LKHANVSVRQIAIGGADNQEIEFTVGGQLTTANAELSNEYKQTSWAKSIITETHIKVSMMKLDTFLDENGISEEFDLLVVDVEGYEAEVFGGFDLSVWQPKMIIVELTETHPDLRSNAKSDAKLGQTILSFGYEIVYKDSINTVFVQREIWKEVLGI
jgi:FkbM family methyltransferase